MSIY
ncbi:a6ea29a4-55aa-48fa-8c46-d78cff59d7b6 [Thermothielavioides terrestris]